MIVYYRVLRTDITNASVVVRYWSDSVSEDSLATSINSNGEISRTSGGWPVRARTDFSVSFHSLNGNDEFNYTTQNVIATIERYAPINLLKIVDSTENAVNNVILMQNVSNLVNTTSSFNPEFVNYIDQQNIYLNFVANSVVDILTSRGIIS